MATMTLREPDLVREFAVPLDGLPPKGPFKTGVAELLIEAAGAEAKPTAVRVRYHLTAFEFQAWIPRLVEVFKLELSPFELGDMLDQGEPVLTFDGNADVLARVPAGLTDLPALEGFLKTGPALFDLGEYALGDVAFAAASPPV